MADIISLFKTASEQNNCSVAASEIDATAFAFASIDEIRARCLPLVRRGAANCDDQPVLRTMFAIGVMLIDLGGSDQEAKKHGWASHRIRQEKGMAILDLVWELWEVDRVIRLEARGKD